MCLKVFRIAEFESEAEFDLKLKIQNSKWRIQYDEQIDENFVNTKIVTIW